MVLTIASGAAIALTMACGKGTGDSETLPTAGDLASQTTGAPGSENSLPQGNTGLHSNEGASATLQTGTPPATFPAPLVGESSTLSGSSASCGTSGTAACASAAFTHNSSAASDSDVTEPEGTPGASGGAAGNASASSASSPNEGTAGGGAGGSASGNEANPDSVTTCAATYTNPILWQDLPDLEVIRVDDAFYYTASTFHHSPGAPILRSRDLVHWQHVGHSVPALDFDPRYDLIDGNAYVKGIWASSLRYRKSEESFYWLGCMHDLGGGYVFTASSAEGPWTKHATERCYYDVGLLVDDDDTLYVAYGNGTINVAQLTPDGLGEVRSEAVFTTPSSVGGPLEGSRFYRIDGDYYIFTTQYANGEYVLRSTNGPFGPYELKPFAVKLPFAGSGAGSSPHQGGIVDTPNGDWYYMAFNDSYPAGRLPVMAPVTWQDGWPAVSLVDGAWGASYPFPNLPCGAADVPSLPERDTFSEATLGHEWEWNHNPDASQWSAGDGLTLKTATVTSDLYAARNTLTRRMLGPTSTGTLLLDYSTMQDGDMAGLAALRDDSAFIGVERKGDDTRLVLRSGLTLDSSWQTSSTGTEVASEEISGGKIWLQLAANVRTDAGGGQARFLYSTDGVQFTSLGSAFTMKKDWQYFLGYRFGIFNYATESLGGSVRVEWFELSTP